MNDVDILLNRLEPFIDKKCMEIKRDKKQNIIMMILCLSFVLIPCILLIFNISIIYIVILAIIIISLKLFIKLPDILKKVVEVEYYERNY